VLKETTNKSHIVFEALASMATVKSVMNETDYRNDMDSWTNFWAGWTYILPERGKSDADMQAHLDKIFSEHIGPITNPGVYKMKYSLRPLLSITPGPMWNNSIGPILPWLFVYVLSGLALVILLTSCFNFTNLSIARSLTRAREIGVRKVTGAMRWQIFTQFITESVVVSLSALMIALVLINFLKPLVLQLHFAQIFRWDLQANEAVYVLFVVFAIVVGIVAGLFPAVVLSGFQPVKVLKSLNNLKLFSRMGMRKALLVSQFTLSLFFILTLLVIYNQLTLFMNKDHGFNMRSNILVRLNNTSHEALKTELLKYNNITSVSAASHVPAAGTSYGAGFKRQLDEPEWTNFNYFLVDENYVENMSIRLVAGTFFAKDRAESNKNFVVINQQAARALHFDTDLDAINEEVIMESDSSRRTIIGVVKDYNHNDLIRAIGPMALMTTTTDFSLLQVAYVGSYEGATSSIEKAWSRINPDLKVDYKEVESEINQFYEIVFGDIVGVLGVISFLAILISCLGMLGMATYATESRIKEISLRKVLGSSDTALIMLLSRGFLTMLGIAIAVGVPAAYFINSMWLNLIAYHTTLDITSIAIGVLILILFGVITIGSQTIRATFVKPVDNLKSE
jgi:putative ABC transport system permease protein